MITVDLKGANDALETLAGMIIPWRRQNAERKAKLELIQRQAEIHHLNAETSVTRAKSERERAAAELDKNQAELITAQVKKTEAEAALILAQAQRAIVEAEKERATLRRSLIELAIKIADRYASGLNELEKMDYVLTKLLPVLDRLVSSNIEPQVLLPPSAGTLHASVAETRGDLAT